MTRSEYLPANSVADRFVAGRSLAAKTADVYRYMNFDQIAEFKVVADTVTVQASFRRRGVSADFCRSNQNAPGGKSSRAFFLPPIANSCVGHAIKYAICCLIERLILLASAGFCRIRLPPR